jgi:hypothetical protein
VKARCAMRIALFATAGTAGRQKRLEVWRIAHRAKRIAEANLSLDP